MNNLYVRTGENPYELHREKMRWIQEFARKHGRENLLQLESGDLTLRALLDEVSVAPFLAEKRLVIVNGVLRCTKEEAQLLVQHLHADILLLFIDPKPDKRSSGIKEILRIAGDNAKNFPPLKGMALSKWLDAYVRDEGGALQTAARDLLLEWNGNDQGMLAGEVEKLLLVAEGKAIGKTLVEQYCHPCDEGIIWTISDLLFAGARPKAIAYTHRMILRGSDPYGLWSMLLVQLKNIVSVRAALSASVPASHIPTTAGLHPFAVQSMLGYCKRLDDRSLRSLLLWAAQEEVRLKTGAYRSTKEEQEEICALIDSLLLRVP